jgi:hypothetical protein
MLLLVHSLLHEAEPAKVALQRAQGSPEVVQRLGTPVTPGWFIKGSISLENDTGHADLEIPIQGPRGQGEIHVIADKEFGRWTYTDMKVGFKTGDQIIDLLGGSSPAAKSIHTDRTTESVQPN